MATPEMTEMMQVTAAFVRVTVDPYSDDPYVVEYRLVGWVRPERRAFHRPTDAVTFAAAVRAVQAAEAQTAEARRTDPPTT